MVLLGRRLKWKEGLVGNSRIQDIGSGGDPWSCHLIKISDYLIVQTVCRIYRNTKAHSERRL